MISRCQISHLIQHILNENSISHCRIIDEDVGDRADNLAVLNNRRAAHEGVQVGTTFLNGKFTKITEKSDQTTTGGDVFILFLVLNWQIQVCQKIRSM